MLFLFDIDGTLILTGGAGFRAFDRALVSQCGFSCPEGLSFAGKTDPLIIEEIYQARTGRAPTAAEIDRVLEAYLVNLEDEIRRAERFRVLPGVAASLAACEAREGAVVGLATGNIEAGARIKLVRGDLWHRFAFGGYGSDAAERARLVARAVERGQAHAGRSFEPKQVVVIGDTPRDVAAAHACGALAVGVATGSYDVDALRACGAEVVFETLEEMPAWLAGR